MMEAAAVAVLGLAWVIAELRAAAATQRADAAIRSEAAMAMRHGRLQAAVSLYRAAVQQTPRAAMEPSPDAARAAKALDDIDTDDGDRPHGPA
jgi:hypothetical protein